MVSGVHVSRVTNVSNVCQCIESMPKYCLYYHHTLLNFFSTALSHTHTQIPESRHPRVIEDTQTHTLFAPVST